MANNGISAQEAFKAEALTSITDAVRQHTTTENCWIDEMAEWSKVATRLGATPLEMAAAYVRGLMTPSEAVVVESQTAEKNS